MIPLNKKQLLNNFEQFFKQKCYWMGEPVIIISYVKNKNKFFVIVDSNEIFNSFNIYLNKKEYWTAGKCKKPNIIDHINYLSSNLIRKKHDILYNLYNFKILLFHPQE